MFRTKRSSAYALAGLLIAAGVLVVPILAGSPMEPPDKKEETTKKACNLSEAREIAALIAKGQLKVADATQMAEKHVTGLALEATCCVEPGEPLSSVKSETTPPKTDPAAHPARPEPSAERRLIYEVPCFAKDKVMVVRIDGSAKKVIDVRERKEAEGGPSRP